MTLCPLLASRSRKRATGFALIAAGFLISLVMGAPAQAQTVIWDNNAPPTGGFGLNMSFFAEADDFTFATARTVNVITFWASPNDGTFSEFSGVVGWAFRTNTAGTPGAIISSGTVSGANVTVVNEAFNSGLSTPFKRVALNIGSASLVAGTYWLELRENAIGSAFDGTSVFWASTSGTQGNVSRWDSNFTSPTFPSTNSSDLAFRLTGTVVVPEPGSGVLGLLTVVPALGVLWAKRRR